MNATERRAEAIWIDSRNAWVIKVQKDGLRKAFQSSVPGRKGKREAEAKADAWLTTGKSDMGFPQAWALFLDYHRVHDGPANYEHYEYIGRIYLLPNIRTTKISRITPMQWQKCIDVSVSRGNARRTCKNIRDTISAFYTFADKMRWNTTPPRRGDLDISKARPSKPKKILQPDDLRTLMTQSQVAKRGKPEEAFYIHAWRMIALTGLRRGELCGLRREDLEGEVFHIRRSVSSLTVITDGKTDKARRDVQLSSLALRELRAQEAMLDSLGIRSEWLFPDEQGEMTNPRRMYKQWTMFCRTYGIQSTIHEMRHTYISVLKNDMPEQMLKDQVGHTVDMDTFGVYGHVVNTEMQRAKSIMDIAFSRVLGSVGDAQG